MTVITRLVRSRQAATAIDYGLIDALIAVAATPGLGTSVRTTFNNAAPAMTG